MGEPIGTVHPQSDYAGRSFPPNHEGHWGWRADQILGHSHGVGGQTGSGQIDQWMELYPRICRPTCVLVHLGTNDICQGDDVADVMSARELRQIVARVSHRFPGISALIAAPIPSCCDAVNSTLAPAIRSSFVDRDKWGFEPSLINVSLVDVNSGFDQAQLYDGCHPDTRGEDFLAECWFEAVQRQCAPVLATEQPAAHPAVFFGGTTRTTGETWLLVGVLILLSCA